MQDALDSVCQFHTQMNAPISPRPRLLVCDWNAVAVLNALATAAMAAASEDDVLLRWGSMALEEFAELLVCVIMTQL